ncbi:MAG: hypothetical protein U1E30_02195 [Rhodoblastus sp.]
MGNFAGLRLMAIGLAGFLSIGASLVADARPVARRPVAGPGVGQNRYYRPVRPRPVVVVNPRRYWAPGGAIAAGAAVGFLAGAAAASVAGQPPRSGYCWYYVDATKSKGFWDVCPQ